MTKKGFYLSLTDEELFVLLHNDKKAEGEFYRRYKQYVKSYIRKYYVNSLEREDLIQEGMIGLFHAIESYNSEKGAKFSTYAGVCIRNRISTALKIILKHRSQIDGEKDVESIGGRSTPESAAILSEISGDIRKIIKNLPAENFYILRGYLEGKSYKTIAEELEISPKKVDNILLKIRALLSGHVKKYRGSEKGRYPAALASAMLEILDSVNPVTLKDVIKG